MGVGADDRAVGEGAPAVAAVAPAVARREQHVGAGRLQTRHDEVERVGRVVGVVAGAADGEVPARGERAPAVADHQGPRLLGLGVQDRAQVGEGRDRVREQAVDGRSPRPPGEQHGDVDQRRLRGGDERVEGAHRAVVHLELTRFPRHPGRVPAARGVQRDVPAEVAGDVRGVDPGVQYGERDARAVQPLARELVCGQQPRHVVPVAHRGVAAAGEVRLDHRVGEDADDVGAERRQQGQPDRGLVVGDLPADQDRGVLGGEREAQRLVQRERVAARRRDRARHRHRREGGVQDDPGQAVGDLGRGGGPAGVGHGRDDVRRGAELDQDPHGTPPRG